MVYFCCTLVHVRCILMQLQSIFGAFGCAVYACWCIFWCTVVHFCIFLMRVGVFLMHLGAGWGQEKKRVFLLENHIFWAGTDKAMWFEPWQMRCCGGVFTVVCSVLEQFGAFCIFGVFLECYWSTLVYFGANVLFWSLLEYFGGAVFQVLRRRIIETKMRRNASK